MIRFFRNVRKRLLPESNFSRYLLYAIGEIILIVVGIMIALQLDNYNAQKKQEAEMEQMLSELRLELESNLIQSHRVLQQYKIKDRLIRLHLCNAISKEDINNQFAGHFYIGVNHLAFPPAREILDKILTNLENLPEALTSMKDELRNLDSNYDEITDNNNRLAEISRTEIDYRAKNISWLHKLWNWSPEKDPQLNELILEYIFENPRFKNQLGQYWNSMARNSVPDLIILRQAMIAYLESVSAYLSPNETFSYQAPEEFRFDLSEITGTYQVWSKAGAFNSDTLDMGKYILFEDNGRLFTYSTFDPAQQKNVEGDQKIEWVVLDSKSVISPTGWFMHLVHRDSTGISLEYAACNNRNLYFTKID
ncbi:DUF6090 family protein [Robiginitalea sp. IMCC44478]|uniref:DUF6090 family protein n=1 Tax=Robiginitalea sp. IMCC44478 TaxID=3459122 RepID=UPI004042EB4B